jgi:hypothetical protein
MNEDRLFEIMDNTNGEIMLKPGRYGGGWLAIGCCTDEFSSTDYTFWDELCCGDIDYSDARDYFKNHEEVVFIEHAKDARVAMDLCIVGLIKKAVNVFGE